VISVIGVAAGRLPQQDGPIAGLEDRKTGEPGVDMFFNTPPLQSDASSTGLMKNSQAETKRCDP
jgi:hypothetical protein